ncbi:MAG: K(+)-transporting ATPase subunit C [Fimbriimonadaceae bacterium]|nr:K(+)-transporting ATPase subunit C [Fimbriimonadaceae bacterium]
MLKLLRPALALVAVFVVLTGVLFPLAVTAAARAAFPYQSDGSLLRENGKIVGSELLGQNFARPEYFHPRPSAAGAGYDGGNSGGTNLGPISNKLINGTSDDPATPDADESYAGVRQLAEAFRKVNGLAADVALPADAVTRSASGLDPHISTRNAELQVSRVARARGIAEEQVREKVRAVTVSPFLSVFGEPAVNVLLLNRSLDAR